jgi:hypothetical protein
VAPKTRIIGDLPSQFEDLCLICVALDARVAEKV